MTLHTQFAKIVHRFTRGHWEYSLLHVVDEGAKTPLDFDAGQLLHKTELRMVHGETESVMEHIEDPRGFETDGPSPKGERDRERKRHC